MLLPSLAMKSRKGFGRDVVDAFATHSPPISLFNQLSSGHVGFFGHLSQERRAVSL